PPPTGRRDPFREKEFDACPASLLVRASRGRITAKTAAPAGHCKGEALCRRGSQFSSPFDPGGLLTVAAKFLFTAGFTYPEGDGILLTGYMREVGARLPVVSEWLEISTPSGGPPSAASPWATPSPGRTSWPTSS